MPKSINLHVPLGQHQRRGTSDCGKPTLQPLVLRLDAQYEDQIRLDSQLIVSTCRERGIVLQDHPLFSWLALEQNIAAGLHNALLRANQRPSLLAERAALIDLGGFEKSWSHQVQGGLLNRPRVLLLGDSFGALTRRSIRSLFNFNSLGEPMLKVSTTTSPVLHPISALAASLRKFSP